MIVSQNLVVADTNGTIAWKVIGSLVRRKNHTGRVPYPGSDPAFGWQGWLDRSPGVVNPEKGYWTTANNRPDDALASAISTAYVPPHRSDRIGELIEEHGDWTPEAVSAMQLDTMDRSAAELLTSPDLPLVRECAGYDCGWLFMDTTKNRSRRWCDMATCGNRAKGRRHYERRRAAGPKEGENQG